MFERCSTEEERYLRVIEEYFSGVEFCWTTLFRYCHFGSFTLTDVVGGGLLVPLKIAARLFCRAVGLDHLFANTEFANHGDEVFLMFKSDIPYDTVYTEGDRAVSAAMIKMWTREFKHLESFDLRTVSYLCSVAIPFLI